MERGSVCSVCATGARSGQVYALNGHMGCARCRRKRLQLNQKYFPWIERAILIFQELQTGWANLCWEGQQGCCGMCELCYAPLARFAPCVCRVGVTVHVSWLDHVLPVLPAVVKHVDTHCVDILALDTRKELYPQPGRFLPACLQRFNTWQPFLLCPKEIPMYNMYKPI